MKNEQVRIAEAKHNIKQTTITRTHLKNKTMEDEHGGDTFGLLTNEVEAMTEMVSILRENCGEDSEDTWAEQMGTLCELREGDNFIE